MRSGRLGWVALFAVAMAYVEAAVVEYLRRLLGVVDLARDVALYDRHIAATEIGREAATLLMLATLGCVPGRSRQARFGIILFAFGLWDLFYYAWLRVLLGWPRSAFDPDLLFLIPVPWWGPVLAPVLIAILFATYGAVLVARDGAGATIRLRPGGWVALLIGILLVLYSFMADALHALPAGAEQLSRLKPTPFHWSIYIAGLAAMSFALGRSAFGGTRSGARTAP